MQEGLIVVNGKRLRETLTTKVKAEQNNLRNYLYELAKKTSEHIQNRVEAIGGMIKESADGLTNFVGFVENLTNSNEEFK